MPSASDVGLARARAQKDKGHLREALAALEAIHPGRQAERRKLTSFAARFRRSCSQRPPGSPRRPASGNRAPMRCPKCHYISFDSTDRCRNCGYEFSLSADLPESDLQIQTGEEPLGPLRRCADRYRPRVAGTTGELHRAIAAARPSHHQRVGSAALQRPIA